MRRAGESSSPVHADPVERMPWRRVGALHLAVAAILIVVVWQSAEHLTPGEAGLGPRTTLSIADGVLGPWLNWDAGAFHDIADNGYRREDRLVYDAGGQSRVAYFPGYPLVARGVGTVVGDLSLGMVIVTLASGVGAVLLFNRWLRSRMEVGARTCAVLALLVFPWTFFLVATGYSDALFLLTAIAAFVLMEEDRPFAATACAFVSTLTRPVGGAVTVGLVVLALERRSQRAGGDADDRGARRGAADLAVVASIGGLLCFMAFCWSRYGDPLAFSVVQRGWGQEPGPRTWLKLDLLDAIQEQTMTWFLWRLVLQGLVAILFAAAIPAVWRRFGTAYGIYTAIVVVIPLIGAAAFASLGRYVLAAFPVFALLGENLDSWVPFRRHAYLIASAAALLLWTSFWARGFWMG